MDLETHREHMLERRITRRAAIKAGGIAAVGLTFAKPIIETIYPKPIFATGGTGMLCTGSAEINNPTAQVTAPSVSEAITLALAIWEQELGLVCAGNCAPGLECQTLQVIPSVDCNNVSGDQWSCSTILVAKACNCELVAPGGPIFPDLQL